MPARPAVRACSGPPEFTCVCWRDSRRTGMAGAPARRGGWGHTDVSVGGARGHEWRPPCGAPSGQVGSCVFCSDDLTGTRPAPGIYLTSRGFGKEFT